MEEKEDVTVKTGYDWSFEANIRVLDIANWDTNWSFYEASYYEEEITAREFYRRLELCKVKPDSTPRKTAIYLEYRMYGLVPYNISPIQQGIQFGHAVVDYGRDVTSYTNGIGEEEKIYNKWADNDKTFIILNGGTTNTNPERLGTLNQHLIALNYNGVLNKEFIEPDLGDQLTGIVFLVDERVFDRITYPDFAATFIEKSAPQSEKNRLEKMNQEQYEAWVEKIGGIKNAFLREFLRGFRLA